MLYNYYYKNAKNRRVSSEISRFKSLGTLTFFKDFRIGDSLAADYSVGSPAATFTASRSASTPATYVDGQGRIQLVTASNVPRFQGGYYDSTGFHAKKGLMMERASTNLVPKSSVIDDATWTETNTVAANADAGSSSPDGTATAPSLTASADNGTLLLATAVTAQTYSVWLKRKTGTGAVSITANGGTGYTTVTLTTSWGRFQVTTASASQTCGIKLATNTDAVYVWGNQFENLPYATSFIPTTTAALTRNVESLSYLNAGNRTAATESVFIKFAPNYTWANNGLYNTLCDTGSQNRQIHKGNTNTVVRSLANSTTSSGVALNTATTPQANTSYVATFTYKATNSPSPTLLGYINGVSEGGTAMTTNFAANVFGTNFGIGMIPATPGYELDGIIQAVGFLSNVLDGPGVSTGTGILQ